MQVLFFELCISFVISSIVIDRINTSCLFYMTVLVKKFFNYLPYSCKICFLLFTNMSGLLFLHIITVSFILAIRPVLLLFFNLYISVCSCRWCYFCFYIRHIHFWSLTFISFDIFVQENPKSFSIFGVILSICMFRNVRFFQG